MRFGMMEMLILFAVLLLFFGASRLPTLGSSLGSAIRNFKKGFGGEDDKNDEPPAGNKPASLTGSQQVEGSNVASKTKQT